MMDQQLALMVDKLRKLWTMLMFEKYIILWTPVGANGKQIRKIMEHHLALMVNIN
jgi:hypothetical protein